jgi:hypothetical protein
MNLGPEFASCLLKVSRAQEHLDGLKAEFSEWFASDPYFISKTSNTDGSHHGVAIEITKPPNFDRWSLISAECIHNLRTALDTALYAVAIRESGLNPPPNASELQFPIAESPDSLEKQMRRRKLTSLSTRTQIWIERAQPYNRPHGSNPPVLRLLNELDNSNKHRMLNLAVQHLSEGKITFRSPLIDGVPTIHFLRTPIYSGVEFAFFTLNPPQRDVKFDFQGSLTISISHSPGPDGGTVSSLHDLLAVLVREVGGIINGAI